MDAGKVGFMTPNNMTGRWRDVFAWHRCGRWLRVYSQLTKLHIVGMVLVACGIGLLLAGAGQAPWTQVGWTLLGTALFAGGACALNQYQDRKADGLMERTRHRPLPAGKISAAHALAFGIGLVLAGCVVLAGWVNFLTAGLGLLTTFLYVLVYSPLKTVTWLSIPLGAIAGALPALMGWTAVTGRAAPGGWLLFAMVFLWQHVHFYTIAWLHRDDYRKAGYRMLPVVAGGGERTFRHLAAAAAALLPLSLLLTGLGLTGPAYACGAVLAGAGLLATSMALYRVRTRPAARAVRFVTLCYLPILLGMIILDLYL